MGICESHAGESEKGDAILAETKTMGSSSLDTDVEQEECTLSVQDILRKSKEGKSLLMIAVESKKVGVARRLLESGHEVNQVEQRSGECPIHKAVIMKDLKMIEMLIEYGADPNLMDLRRNTSLHVAVKNFNSDVLEFLLRCPKMDTELRDDRGRTALELGKSNKDVVKLFRIREKSM
eukprot:CAMPEP_0167760034 /NCGR_PEP_ID=MMETSP0110_2-20121227/11363_1 /TAXON_ID=629695 /ORGANISM="Gymnochlora sp., Strain CCMP2014" /LENGTH=177 /DNA_ID=CAMNT_0007646503 /DNA_START=376 /DNA_END=912 /DNA_ORIENTATION=-